MEHTGPRRSPRLACIQPFDRTQLIASLRSRLDGRRQPVVFVVDDDVEVRRVVREIL